MIAAGRPAGCANCPWSHIKRLEQASELPLGERLPLSPLRPRAVLHLDEGLDDLLRGHAVHSAIDEQELDVIQELDSGSVLGLGSSSIQL